MSAILQRSLHAGLIKLCFYVSLRYFARLVLEYVFGWKQIGMLGRHRPEQACVNAALVDGGMFEVAVSGNGLKHLDIDAPSAAAELMDERGRDRGHPRRRAGRDRDGAGRGADAGRANRRRPHPA